MVLWKRITDAVGLEMIGFCPCMIDIFNTKVKLIRVTFNFTTILCAPIGKNPQEANLLFIEDKHISCGDSRFFKVKFGKGNSAICIDESLLVDSPYAFHRTYKIGILGAKITRVMCFNLAMGFTLRFCFSKVFNRLPIVSSSWRIHIERTPPAETMIPRCSNS